MENVKNIEEQEEKKFILIKKEGRVVLKHIEPSLVAEVNDKCKLHLCAENCAKFGVFTCPKIGDRKKQTIDKYEFITDGHQVYRADKRLEEFKVTGCTSYEKAEPKKLTTEEKRHIAKTKRDIMSAYFETGTVDEAQVEQYMQMIHGVLIDAEEKVVPDKVLLNKILKQPNAEALLEEVVAYKKSEIAKKISQNVRSKQEMREFAKQATHLQEFENALSKLRSVRQAKEHARELELQSLREKGIKENKIK